MITERKKWIVPVLAVLCLLLGSCTRRATTSTVQEGACPKCGAPITEVTVICWDGQDSEGKPTSGIDHHAVCPKCKAKLVWHLYDSVSATGKQWRVEQEDSSNQVPHAIAGRPGSA